MKPLGEEGIAEILAWRDRERAKNRAKAAKARERRSVAGLVQCNMWCTEEEAKNLRLFLALSREKPIWRLYAKQTREEKWISTELASS